MRRWRRRAGIGLPVLFIALGLQVPAAAKTHSHVGATAEASRELPQPPRMLAGFVPDRIIAIVEKRHNAKVVKAEKDDLKGRRIYVLRLLSKKGGLDREGGCRNRWEL